MAVQNVNYVCPSCNAPLRYNASKGLLTCDYCDSEYTPAQVEQLMAQKLEQAGEKAGGRKQDAAAKEQRHEERAQEATTGQTASAAGAAAAGDAVTGEETASKTKGKKKSATGDPIQDYLNSKRTLKEGDENAMAVSCSSCGATLIVSDVSAVTCCPYCGNTAIVPGQLGDTLEPDYIIPFSTTKEQAMDMLKQHCQGKICLPKVFAEQNHVEEIQGIYVPFWLYDGTCNGQANWVCTNVRVFDDGEYEVTETDTWHVSRAGYCDFERVPADASQRMPNDHMDSIEPFDYSKMVKYSPSYLPGFAAERYDDEVADCASRIKSRMETTVINGLESSVGVYGSKIRSGASASQNITNVGYALLPVWMLHTKWNDQDFLFAMNGQTTKLVGDLPVDKKKLNLLTLAGFAVGFVAAFAGVLAMSGGGLL